MLTKTEQVDPRTYINKTRTVQQAPLAIAQ